MTVQTLLLVSILWYRAIISPFNTVTFKKAKLHCGWLDLLLSFQVYFSSISHQAPKLVNSIVNSRLGIVITKLYRFTLSAVGLAIPLFCMTITYLLTIHKLYTRHKSIIQTTTFRFLFSYFVGYHLVFILN